MDTNPPLRRLKTLSHAERALYWQLFRSTGGDGAGSPVSGSSVAGLLQRSGLPQDVLRRIWKLADHTSLGSLDFEGFCVACRLCAHAQLQAPGTPLSEATVAEVPVVPPVFKGSAPPPEDGVGRSGDVVADPGFDFEATAFGVDGSAQGPPSRPPDPSQAAELGLEAGFVPGSHRAAGSDSSLRDRGGRTLRSSERLSLSGIEEDEEDDFTSVTKLKGALSDKASGRGAERLGRELLEVRGSLDDQCRRKGRLEQGLGKLRARLEAGREERHKVSMELARRRADLEHIWATLEFERQQIREAERETAALREARQAFSEEDTGAAEAALAAHRRSAQDLRSAAELGERVRRALRGRLELQARQQLLLAEQRQAEQERSYAQGELEGARGALEALQRDRAALGRERLAALREAARLAHGAGLGPATAQPGGRSRRGVPSEPRGSPGSGRGRVAAGLVSAAAQAEQPPAAMLGPAGSAGGLSPEKAMGWAQFGSKEAKQEQAQEQQEEPGAAFWRELLNR